MAGVSRVDEDAHVARDDAEKAKEEAARSSEQPLWPRRQPLRLGRRLRGIRVRPSSWTKKKAH